MSLLMLRCRYRFAMSPRVMHHKRRVGLSSVPAGIAVDRDQDSKKAGHRNGIARVVIHEATGPDIQQPDSDYLRHRRTLSVLEHSRSAAGQLQRRRKRSFVG